MSLKSKSILFISAAIALSAGFWIATQLQKSIDADSHDVNTKALDEARRGYSPIQGTILSPPRKISVPALLKDNAEKFTNDDLKDQWHLMFFGYTHCPDVCPTTMGTLAQAKKAATANNQIFPQVIFVSVDPERDKAALLSEYIKYFDEDFIGVTGDDDLIRALTLQMSVVYLKMPVAEGDDPENYVVDHSAALLLINPEGKLAAFLNPPFTPESISKDFKTVVNNYKK
ncbi:MAG: SCO family protein [Gammaproteobacteria bacterium]|nr:SCO family protein [Gammaproteobacteria bacterium]